MMIDCQGHKKLTFIFSNSTKGYLQATVKELGLCRRVEQGGRRLQIGRVFRFRPEVRHSISVFDWQRLYQAKAGETVVVQIEREDD